MKGKNHLGIKTPKNKRVLLR